MHFDLVLRWSYCTGTSGSFAGYQSAKVTGLAITVTRVAPAAYGTEVTVALTPRRRILLVLLSAQFLALMTLSIINVALPAIQQGIGATDTHLQWLISGFTLAFGIGLVPAGRLGDLYGRGQIFFVGVSLFSVSSLAGAFVWAPGPLIAMRVVMGLGAALITPQITGIIQEHFDGMIRARAYGYLGAVVGIGVAVGPTVGGLLIHLLPSAIGWRSTLAINFPIGLAVLVLARLWLPRDQPRARKHLDFDPVGMALLAVGVFSILLPFTSKFAISSLLWGGAGLTLLGLWIWWEKWYASRSRSPMVDLWLFKFRSFSMGTVINSLYFLGGPAIWFLQAQFIQNGLGYTALVAGLVPLPASVLIIFAAPLAARLVVRIGRWVTILGLVLVAVGSLVTGLLAESVNSRILSVWWFAVPIAVIGIGTAFVTSPNQTLAMRDIYKDQGSVAGGVLATGAQIAIAVGMTAITGVYFHAASKDTTHAFQISYGLIVAIMLTAITVTFAEIFLTRKKK